jgi:hypothetical protein
MGVEATPPLGSEKGPADILAFGENEEVFEQADWRIRQTAQRSRRKVFSAIASDVGSQDSQ